MIDYFCFLIKKESLKEKILRSLNRPTEDRFEQFSYQYKNEIIASRQANKIIIYDEHKNIMIDGTGQEITNLENKTIFPRVQVGYTQKIVSKIQELGGVSVSNYEDFLTILNWHKKVKTKREIIETTFGEFISGKYNQMADKIFIKTVEKDFSSVCEQKNGVWYYLDSNIPITKRMKKTDLLLITPAVKIVKDNDCLDREWRCFIIDNQVVTMNNYYTHEPLKETVVIDWIKNKVQETKGKLSSCYCMDVMEYETENGTDFDIVEFNPPIPTGGELIPLVQTVFDLPFEDEYLTRARRQAMSIHKNPSDKF